MHNAISGTPTVVGGEGETKETGPPGGFILLKFLLFAELSLVTILVYLPSFT